MGGLRGKILMQIENINVNIFSTLLTSSSIKDSPKILTIFAANFSDDGT